jgi:hypothetical protein
VLGTYPIAAGCLQLAKVDAEYREQGQQVGRVEKTLLRTWA